MRLLERIKNGSEELTEEASTNTSLNAVSTIFEQIRENGSLPTTHKLAPAPNDINQKVYYERVRDKTKFLLDHAPTAYAGKLVLNVELSDEKSLKPIGLGNQGWLWDVVQEGGTLVFTPAEQMVE